MPPRPPRRFASLILAVGGGLVTETAFPDKSWWPMAFLGVALLVLALRRDSARWGALVGFAWGIAFFLPHIWWANYAVGVIPWIALSVAEAGIVALGCAVWVWTRRGRVLSRRTLGQSVPFAIVWIGTEQLRQVWPFGGFPWGRLAFSQADGPLLRLASLGGAPLVSAAVAAVGFLLAVAWLSVRRLNILRGPTAVLLAAVIVGGSGFIPLATQAESGTLRVGAVQGNVASPGLGAFNNAREVLNNHVAGTEALLEQVEPGSLDVVLWPENASDINPRADADAAALIEVAAQDIGAPILLGTDRYESDARYNDMVLWVPGEGSVFSYSKQIPAAFAEYIPMRDIARIFSPAVDLVRTDMAPGTERAVVPVESARLGRTVPLATVICFEVAYDAVIREAILAGGELLVVPTNNASFGYTTESTQQLAMSRLRAVEHGRATVQISTVGVSGIIAPNGVVLQETELFAPAQLVAELPLRTSLTVADRLGDWPIIMATALALLGLLAGIVTGRPARSSRSTGSSRSAGSPRSSRSATARSSE